MIEQNLGFVNEIKEKARQIKGAIALPEGQDPRVLTAAEVLLREELVGKIYLFGKESELKALAREQELSQVLESPKVTWVPSEDPLFQGKTQKHLIELAASRGKNLREDEAALWAKRPLEQAAYAVATGMAEAALAGSLAATAEVIRAALRGIGLAPGLKTISSSFAMIRERPNEQAQHYIYGDCGVVIDPNAEQLCDIAKACADTFQSLFSQQTPRLAFLSFATKGSAQHPLVDKVRAAAELFHQRYPEILSDGELQFDAALLPEIAARKAPGSQTAGQANCFIFPQLDAGNIAYKITERLAGFAAFGPILQGSAKPYSDLSRGASPNDIVISALIALLRA